MPVYVYRCRAGHLTERNHRLGQAPATVRCHCHRRAHRLYTPPAGVHFKGPGFYRTDYGPD